MFLFQKYGYDYKHIDANFEEEINTFLEKLYLEKPDFFCYDTETDGLSIITNKPFLVSMGFNKTVITFDYTKERMKYFFKLFLPEYDDYIGMFAHNAKFDYHMMWNGGSKIPDNLVLMDSITVVRLTEYADEVYKMSLEAVGERYVNEDSKFAGKIIKDLIKGIDKTRRLEIRAKLMEEFQDEGLSVLTKTNKLKGTKKLTDLLHKYEDRVAFIDDDNKFYKFIKENHKKANYEDVYKEHPELMRHYAADDIVIMIGYLTAALPHLKNVDKDLTVTRREGELIRPVAEMEKVGLRVDVNYVLESRKRLCDYRDFLYFELGIITGLDFTVGQHEFIKKMLYTKYGIKTDKSDEKAIKYIRKHCNNEEVELICNDILELRTLDKWISTYVDGKLNSLIEKDGTYRIFTDINNNGAVSGRVSCNMQQQPKDGLKDRDGNELFHPRRMFITDDDYIFAFCDQSQMELRIQANYTAICSSEPDLAMSRAYMPFKCYRYEEPCNDRTFFNYKNRNDLETFNQYTWFRQEDDEPWAPTDLHSETTRHAYPKLEIGSDEFKGKRKYGKTANFLRLYQGGVIALMDSLEVDRETAELLNGAFDKAFPKVKDYQIWVNNTLSQYGYVENLYGRRYYMNDSKWYYKGCNYLIQGTCADMMKVFEIDIHKYLKDNNLKSKMVLPIHDEIMLIVHKDELFVIKEVKKIMENVGHIVKYIPMISDAEVSYTNWAEKVDYETEEE